ncbi:unnamed protein product [Adineta steineri]|uniref:Uncharacterized protein n=1 Tax=Adineta steineri TaxID=433720 RepID=A0A814CSS6_9BILA|nr:unnamed protein product [Adineta steineri]
MTLYNNFIVTNIKSWFLPVDILLLIFSVLIIISTILYLVIIILHKTHHTITMILIRNSCLITFIFGMIVFFMTLLSLENDLKQIEYQDTLCCFGAFIDYAANFA